jgi:hypothetical protein
VKTNLKGLLNQGRLRQHKTSKKEIENLLALVRRDIKDAKVEGLSSDRRFLLFYIISYTISFLRCYYFLQLKKLELNL